MITILSFKGPDKDVGLFTKGKHCFCIKSLILPLNIGNFQESAHQKSICFPMPKLTRPRINNFSFAWKTNVNFWSQMRKSLHRTSGRIIRSKKPTRLSLSGTESKWTIAMFAGDMDAINNVVMLQNIRFTAERKWAVIRFAPPIESWS